MLVTGTGTATGKTWVGAQILAALKADGHPVAARKPAQSYDPGVEVTDADVLALATGEQPTDVCPSHRWYEVPMAPPMAAELLGRPAFSLDDLIDELRWPGGVRYGLVEGVGGPRSPLASTGDTVALAEAVRPDTVVLVARTELGTINAVILAAAALDGSTAPHPPPVVFLNRYREDNPLHAGNAAWLRDRTGLDVVTGVEALVNRLSS
ncbi:MAG: dethiobiotin synthase [Actinomycetota bacterium]|nr:dethiobiotin synthase [Actinomycetota bacterium]MDQ3679846.1 dethiobiotin synthase [Actinomycetota bacterium]